MFFELKRFLFSAVPLPAYQVVYTLWLFYVTYYAVNQIQRQDRFQLSSWFHVICMVKCRLYGVIKSADFGSFL